MAPLHRTAVFLWTLLVLGLVLVVQAQEPEHTINYFPNDPARLFFFEDKTVCFRLRFPHYADCFPRL